MIKNLSLTKYETKPSFNKVPEITLFFWIIKILTTGMGEVTSDYFAKSFDPVIVVAITGFCLLVALAVQLSVHRYVAWIYWLNVIMVSIFGTMAADALHVALGISYLVSTTFFVIGLIIIFVTWYASEKTLSIHSIFTRRRELFYWATVLATFALGTAAGDMTATTMNLGYFFSGVMFALVFAIPAIGYWKFGLNEIFAFWFAYIVTRPLGASFADWMGVPASRSGLDIGTGTVSLVLTVIIVCLVGYMTLRRKDIKEIEDIESKTVSDFPL